MMVNHVARQQEGYRLKVEDHSVWSTEVFCEVFFFVSFSFLPQSENTHYGELETLISRFCLCLPVFTSCFILFSLPVSPRVDSRAVSQYAYFSILVSLWTSGLEQTLFNYSGCELACNISSRTLRCRLPWTSWGIRIPEYISLCPWGVRTFK